MVTIQPARPELVAALEIRPVDLPLAEAGRPVRLQFDGWPAIVVSGWPGTSVGTWGGHVLSVDEVATAKGTYRILVRPDSADTPWPTALRPGSGVRGWTLLKTVPLGYELWRQLNAFPPEYGAATAHADDAGKKP